MRITLGIALITACLVATPAAAAGSGVVSIRAVYETEGFFDDPAGGDADADDPAIWVHPTDRRRSLVLGTLKNGGLAVFDLTGRTVQRIPAPPAPGPGDEPGRFNNVDLLTGGLAVVTDRGRDKLVIYRINPRWGPGTVPLVDVTGPDVPWVFSANQQQVNGQSTAYGLATAGTHGYVSRRSRTDLARVVFTPSVGGRIGYRVVRVFSLPTAFRLPDGRSWTPCLDEDGVLPQVEGMVIDKRDGTLFAAQEPVGVWRIGPSGARLVERVRTFGVPYQRTPDPSDPSEFLCSYGPDPGFGGRRLSADAEGLTIYAGRYLSVSSQGDDTFSVWRIDHGWRFTGSYRVAAGPTDSVEESDGSDVVSTDLGPGYPRGLLVVHDGANTPSSGDRPNTNFKFVPAHHLLPPGE